MTIAFQTSVLYYICCNIPFKARACADLRHHHRRMILYPLVASGRKLTLLLLSLLGFTIVRQTALALYVTSPRSKSDWDQLAALLAEQNKPPEKEKFESVQWELWGRRQAQNAIYRRYVKTARLMKGTKYSVLLAKEWGQVLGLAEMGISSTATNVAARQDRRATLGVLCVSPNARRTGVGRRLVEKCEDVAFNLWQESSLWIEVETSNVDAFTLFSKCGYTDTNERSWVEVQRRQTREKRLHMVLCKTLSSGQAQRNITTNLEQKQQ